MPDRNIIASELIKEWDLEASDHGELIIGGCNTIQLRDVYGTPLHVVNEARLKKTAEDFLETMKLRYSGKISVHYAFKCNPVPGIIKVIRNAGINAEVMSEYELMLALKLGYSGNEIIVNGPYKTDRFITACLENAVRFINVDSLSELERINGLCTELNRNAEVLFRINPDFVPSGMNKGSAAASRSGSPFGLDLKGGEVNRALTMIKEMKRIRFRGFHFHIGSGIQNTDDYRKVLSGLKNILNDAENAGLSVDVMDVGGGLGVPGSREMTTLELLKYQAFDLLPFSKLSDKNISFSNFADSVVSGVLDLFRNKKDP